MSQWNYQPSGGRPRDQRWREMAAGIGLSALFHGGIIAIALFGMWCVDEAPPEEDEGYELVFDDVELLALGEERDPHTLPRLTGDEGAPPETDEMVDISPDEEEATPPDPDPTQQEEPDPEQVERERQQQEEAQRERERRRAEQERRRRMDQALGRFETDGRGDEAPEGSPEGVAGGTATDADRADMMQTYYARLLREIERHWEIPSTISDAELAQLAGRVRVFVTLTDDGYVANYEFRQKSEHEQFDDSIERVMRQFEAEQGGHQLPLPEAPQIRQEITNRGLMLTNWETLKR